MVHRLCHLYLTVGVVSQVQGFHLLRQQLRYSADEQSNEYLLIPRTLCVCPEDCHASLLHRKGKDSAIDSYPQWGYRNDARCSSNLSNTVVKVSRLADLLSNPKGNMYLLFHQNGLKGITRLFFSDSIADGKRLPSRVTTCV